MYDTSLNLSAYLQDCPPRHIQPGPALRFLLLSESQIHLLAPASGIASSTAREAHHCLQSLRVEKTLQLPVEGEFIHCEWVNEDCVLVTGRESTWMGQWSSGQWKCVGDAICCSARVEEEKSMTAGPLSFSVVASASDATVSAASAATVSAVSAVSAAAPLATPQEVTSEFNPVSTVLLENSSGSLHLLRVSSGCDGKCSSILPGMKYR